MESERNRNVPYELVLIPFRSPFVYVDGRERSEKMFEADKIFIIMGKGMVI